MRRFLDGVLKQTDEGRVEPDARDMRGLAFISRRVQEHKVRIAVEVLKSLEDLRALRCHFPVIWGK
jgi:hypothetical protein